MAERTTYHVLADRDEKWWVLRIPELDQWSQAKRLDQAEAMAREVIALWLDVAPDSFDVELTSIDMPRLAKMARDQAVDARREAEAAAAKAAEATKRAIAVLAHEGLSLRDVGRILGLSFQRVAQLASEPSVPSVAPVAGRGDIAPALRRDRRRVAESRIDLVSERERTTASTARRKAQALRG